ncbi:hypothetical protein ABEB36_005513 [Hypothenemus hampei]|uniref:Transcription factor Adf-1 n=1 Tax=Hypothenemus hampei TaxID=57062 RepID=A0ABD1EYU7_HYPHA
MAPERFSEEEDERLIDLIAANPSIWNFTDVGYKNQNKKDSVWDDIGKIMNRNALSCKARWKNIRDYYRKQRKQRKTYFFKRISYFNQLKFLDSLAEPEDPLSNSHATNDTLQKSFGRLQESNEEETLALSSVKNLEESDGEEEGQPPPVKVTKNDHCEHWNCHNERQFRDNDEEIDLFFKAMAATAKKFKPDILSQTKIKVFHIIMEMESKNRTGQ